MWFPTDIRLLTRCVPFCSVCVVPTNLSRDLNQEINGRSWQKTEVHGTTLLVLMNVNRWDRFITEAFSPSLLISSLTSITSSNWVSPLRIVSHFWVYWSKADRKVTSCFMASKFDGFKRVLNLRKYSRSCKSDCLIIWLDTSVLCNCRIASIKSWPNERHDNKRRLYCPLTVGFINNHDMIV